MTGADVGHVIIFREEKHRDPYSKLFRESGFRTYFLPVLSVEYLQEPGFPPERFEAVVVTSGRAMAALARHGQVLSRVRALAGHIPWFAVGTSTGRAVRGLGFDLQDHMPGTAEQLIDPVAARAGSVLFLTGDPHRQELGIGLRLRGVHVEEVELYRTTLRPPKDLPIRQGWAVLFSPRGVTATAPVLANSPGLSLAAIGPSTAAALRKAGLPVAAVAQEPTPSALLAAIWDQTERPHQLQQPRCST